MRSLFLIFLVGLCITGCSSSEPQTTDVSEIEQYVNENPEAVARQAELTNSREDEEEEDD